jgi:hypothetical protein
VHASGQQLNILCLHRHPALRMRLSRSLLLQLLLLQWCCRSWQSRSRLSRRHSGSRRYRARGLKCLLLLQQLPALLQVLQRSRCLGFQLVQGC